MDVPSATGDMMVADKIKIAIRVDASMAIGTGHVMRCLTLAENARDNGAEVLFVSRRHPGHLFDRIEDRGFRLLPLSAPPPMWTVSEKEGVVHAAWVGTHWQDDAKETALGVKGFHPDWLVVDHYGLDARWEGAMRASASKIMVIDDLADRSHDCDILLDQNLTARQNVRYKGLVPKHCTLLLGPKYALLQPDYAHLRSRSAPREGPLSRLFVFFGGVDEVGLTQKTVRALLTLQLPNLIVDIVLSSASSQFPEVQRLIEGHPEFCLHDNVPSLAPFILAADLGLGAGGATSWERLCLGLPSLVISLAENQRPISNELARRKLVRWLGHQDSVDETKIRDELANFVESGLEPAWSKKCLAVVDGRGVDRVQAVLSARADMALTVRNAELVDESLLLEWANDAETRRNAFSSKPITLKEHRAWFRRRIRDFERCVLCIAETASAVPLGQIRFDKKSDEWEISYSVARIFRGRGLGRSMLAAGIARFRQEKGQSLLVANVKPENMASRRIFEMLDFKVRSVSSDRYVYERAA